MKGGEALKFYSSRRLEVRKAAEIKDGDISIGNKTKVKVVKNKCAPPFKIAEFDINYGEGISKMGELVDFGVTAGIINKSGSWYSYLENKLGQGRESVIQTFKDNEGMALEVENKIKTKLKQSNYKLKFNKLKISPTKLKRIPISKIIQSLVYQARYVLPYLCKSVV